ncbi:MAG: VPLPA-CTERM sorting domain-containing protein [Pseudomonadales bacterium]
MKFKRSIQAIIASTVLILSSAAFAGTYGVSSTGKINCTTASGKDAPHGLWTNKYRKGGGGGCAQFYDFKKDSTLTVDNGQAHLKAKAKNPYGVVAKIDFKFSNPVAPADWTGVVKTGGTGVQPDWRFYTQGSGDIKIKYEKNYNGKRLKIVDKFSLDLVDNTAMQFGTGANDKTGAFGASAWLDITKWARKIIAYEWNSNDKKWVAKYDVPDWAWDWKLGKHWDFNMELSAVPLPAGAWLFLTGLLVLAGYNSRKHRRSNTIA